MRPTSLLVLGALITALIASGCQARGSQSSPASDAPIHGEKDREAEILGVVQQWQSETGAGGVLAAIATPDDTVSVAVGRAGSDTGTRDVRVDDAFDVFSITKTFVSAEILLLADRGALELDDTIGSHVPELSESLDVTIRDLLGHRSGLADHRDYPNFWTDFFADLDREWTWDEAVGFALSQEAQTRGATSDLLRRNHPKRKPESGANWTSLRNDFPPCPSIPSARLPVR